MRRAATMLAVVVSLFVAYGSAQACGKDGKKSCPFANGKAKLMLTEIENQGYLVAINVKAEGDEAKEIMDRLEKKITGCSQGNCTCKNADHCPYHVEGLAYKVSRSDKGLEVMVTGGTESQRAQFKERIDAKLAKKGGCKGKGECTGECKGDCGCKGECKGDCGCKGECKGDCGCKGECKGDCKGDGSCPHAGTGDCPHAKEKKHTCPHAK